MDIVVSANNNQEVYVLPVVPPAIEITNPNKNEEFETINSGVINLIGTEGLRTLSIESSFPTKSYPFIKKGATSNGWDYITFFNKWSKNRVPIRIIITSKSGIEILNMACTVENFNYGLDRVGDIKYTLEIKEYKFVKAKKVI